MITTSHPYMKIRVTDDKKIKDIQEAFAHEFPFLKIEFFSKAHPSKGASDRKLMLVATKSLGECRSRHNDGVITIKQDMTVTEVEETFNKKFGLSAQIFRMSGKVWLETTVTDGWTLEEQNREGKDLSD